MLKRIFTMLGLLSMGFLSFANTNDMLRHYQEEGTHASASVSPIQMSAMKAKSSQNKEEYKELINRFMRGAGAKLNNKTGQSADDAILLVSFSMPDALMIALLDEASHYQIPVVINGLIDGDFKKTIDAFSRLHQLAKAQNLNFPGLSIDPVWFQQFKISSVPSLIVTERPSWCKAQKVCKDQTFDVVYGNASIKNGLKLIANKGEVSSKLAQKILEQGHV